MKKTLALALVAAMTISMASMTAFAKDVKYSDETGEWPEKSFATVTIKKEDCTETKTPKYKATKTVAASPASYATDAEITEDEYNKLGSDLKAGFKKTDETDSTYTIKFGDLKLKKFDRTATKTFFGWAQVGSGDATKENSAAQWATDSDPSMKKDVLKDDKEITVDFGSGDEAKLYFLTVGRTDTSDEAIAKNLKAIEDAKNNGDAAQKEKDRLAELDKQYNADGKNGYDKTTKEDKELEGKYTQKKKGDTGVGMDDFYTHAANVAGAPVDETKTWVYDVTLPAGTALYSGKTARTTIELDGVKDSADLSKFGVKVYHIEGWCKATKVKNVDVKGNKVSFWSDSFSPYVITLGDGVASTGADASNPSTGDFSAVPVALLAAAALGATGFVAYKKRKAE